MQPSCVCVLLLAVTSSSLGTPLVRRRGEWLTQHKNYGSPVVDREQHRSGNVPLSMVLDERTDIHVMTENKNFAPAPPKSFDWRTKGVITPVENQGELGSPVAIAATECVESLFAVSKGLLVQLSAPEVQDCCSRFADNVFECIHNIGGLCGEQTYPVVTGHCRNTSCQPEVQIAGGKTVPAKQVMQMTEALLMNPLMVLIDASKPSFETYQAGIYSDPDCSKVQVDHAMQLVGYGEEDGKEYWICKNSWGATWGEEGYIRVLKGSDMCGIESFASYPY